MVELLIGLAISGMVLAQVCMLWYYSSRAFVAQMNYVDMDQISQRTLDTLSREIRQTKSLTSFAPTQLVFKDADDLPLTYAFSEKQLVRIKNGQKKVLLKDCETGSFSIYQRNPVEGAYDQYPTASAATCKLVEIKWRCTRQLFPSAPVTKESMQSAKIVLRNP
jgi:Tfp pilus assembly protein PilW